MPQIEFKLAATPKDFESAKSLFVEYAQSLPISLDFQNFNAELEILEEMYGNPTGCIILGYRNEQAVACVGVRRIDEAYCELKRMYVKPDCRTHGAGRQLLALALLNAKELAYKYIRLDTLTVMTTAITLYKSAGFYEIDPYYQNPVEGSVYMEKVL
jgi:ribosomal protein S18 acetylase RimI-like enzyme